MSGSTSGASTEGPRTPVPRRGGRTGRSASTGRPRTGKNRSDARRRQHLLIAGASVAAVIIVVLVLVATKVAGGGPSGPPRTPLPPSDAAKLTNVPLQTLLQAGTQVSVIAPSPPATPQSPLTSAGKPEMLYIGAEFCPICAAQRWPMIVALSHFGTFTSLSKTHSAVSDGNIPTLSFYGSSFSSPYLVFTPVETTTNQRSGNFYKALETPTPEQQAIWARNSPGGQLTFPFIDIGGKWLLQTSQYSATLLEGKNFDQIVRAVGDNSSTVGAHIDASAAVLIRTICTVTGDQPAPTCDAANAATFAPAVSTSGSSSSSP